MKNNPSPHDSLMARLFSSKKNVRDFLKQYLPPEIREEINLTKISIDMNQYISDELKKFTSDIVIKTETKRKKNQRAAELDIYILFEHKSYHDNKIMIQLLRYMYLMYQKDSDEGRPCRIIIPFVFYHGKAGWKIPNSFQEQFPVNHVFKKYCLNYKYILFDTHRWDFDEEMKKSISRNIETFTSIMLLKSAFEKNIDFLVKVIDFLRQNDFLETEGIDSNSHLIIILEYISQTRDITLDELNNIINKSGIEGDKIMPTLAQRLAEKGKKEGIQIGLQEGIQKGLKEGMHKKAVETALSLLNEGMSVKKAAGITGLPEKEVLELKKNK